MDKEKNLKLMRFWLFGTFVIIFTAASIFSGYLAGLEIFKTAGYWLAMGAAALLCAGAFYVYRSWLDKK